MIIRPGSLMEQELDRTDLSPEEREEVCERSGRDFMFLLRDNKEALRPFVESPELSEILTTVAVRMWFGGLIHGLRMGGAEVTKG